MEGPVHLANSWTVFCNFCLRIMFQLMFFQVFPKPTCISNLKVSCVGEKSDTSGPIYQIMTIAFSLQI